MAMYETLTRAMHSSWWEWLDGSRLFFWRWPTIWLKEARDGARAFQTHFPPPCLRYSSPPIKEEWIRLLDMEKLKGFIRKRSLESGKGRTKVTIPRHPVPKGPTDI
jgi:hypothetical protein